MDLLNDIKNLGIKKGDKIVVHTALSKIGWVEGGPKAVCEAFMTAVGKEGILMMPSFGFGVEFEESGSGIFDVLNSISIVGAVAECFRSMDGVYRSYDPTHSICAWGDNALDYVSKHHLVSTMDYGSPLAILEKNGGKAVMIGCPGSNTFHHIVEVTNSVACLGKRTVQYPAKLPSGKEVKLRGWGWRNGICPITDDNCFYYDEMKNRQLINIGLIGHAETWVFKLSDCRNVLEEYLNGKIEGCAGCSKCDIKPGSSPFDVESDWDEDLKKIKDSTDAYTGEYELK